MNNPLQVTTGLIISSFGRQFIVEIDNKPYQAVTKSKITHYVVGDIVNVEIINNQQLRIISLNTRNNLIYRQDSNKHKLIASNVSQILIIIAIRPNFNQQLLDRSLLFAESQNIKPYIIINKSDLPESQDFIKFIENNYQNTIGYPVIKVCATKNCNELVDILNNNTSVLIGQSGVGKSTITNQLAPHALRRVDDITKTQTSGKHTTTQTTLYHINDSSSIIDCPGLQEFGLYNLTVEELPNLFPELRDYLGKCKFRNCLHLNEPDCAIHTAFLDQKISESRLELLKTLTLNLGESKFNKTR